MYLLSVFSATIFIFTMTTSANDIFHQKSRITFHPDRPSLFFGYTVVLNGTRIYSTNSAPFRSLIVGAPKAASRVRKAVSPGQLFACTLSQLESQNVTCSCMDMDNPYRDRSFRTMFDSADFFRNDMWLGATIAIVPSERLFVCAPRWTNPYRDKHLLALGACYVENKRRGTKLIPLDDNAHLAVLTDGLRREYGEYGLHLNLFAYGQAGMSVKVTENDSVIIGAPGIMQWTGGVIDYRFSRNTDSTFSFSKRPVFNPYFTKELGPDDYFGYSVESGIFEVNGSTLYVAGAPRSKLGYGQVLIFKPYKPTFGDNEPLDIRAKVRGPQLGSYFGASLCCTDLNGDGRADLLVGAPNFVTKKEEVPFDQGAVFVYLASGENSTLIMEPAGYVSGSGESGARFGTSIAVLGDVDGDGHNDVAIGAPWENDGLGAVYIYRGSVAGLRTQYSQRIIAEDARGFGFSISKGLDVDNNNCNDLAVGAYDSATAYLYRCVPTIQLQSSIKVPDAMNLPKNVTSFVAVFCVKGSPSPLWPHVKMDLKATLTIDPEYNRASIPLSDYRITAHTGSEVCEEQSIDVRSTADLSKPILIKMDLEPVDPLFDDSPTFHKDATRISEDSTMQTSILIQLIRDCGDDLICTPLLVLSLDAIDSEYVPGTSNRLGIRVSVLNKEEPAYGAKVYLYLPLPPKRVPGFCSLTGLNMTCDVKAPLERGKSEEWEVELEYTHKSVLKEIFKVEAELKHPLYIRNENKKAVQDVNITVIPKAKFKLSGKTLQNHTITISREKFYEGVNVSFTHYYEITNLGPSDWNLLEAVINISENVTLSSTSIMKGCEYKNTNITCAGAIAANESTPLKLTLKYDLKKYGKYLEDNTTLNVTTDMILYGLNQSMTLTTTLVLEPENPIWPFIVAIVMSSLIGLLLLAGIVYGFYKRGFFSRATREALKREKEKTQEGEGLTDEEPGCSTSPASVADDSTLELLSEDSD